MTRFVREGAARPRIAAGGRAADVPRSERKGARTCDARGGSSRGRRHLAHRVKAGTQAEHRVVSLQVGKPSVAIETSRLSPLHVVHSQLSLLPTTPPSPVVPSRWSRPARLRSRSVPSAPVHNPAALPLERALSITLVVGNPPAALRPRPLSPPLAGSTASRAVHPPPASTATPSTAPIPHQPR